MYEEGKTGKEILEKYSDKIRCENTIIKIVQRNGVKVRKRGKTPVIKNEDIFEKIDTEEKAYMLGLLMADGYVICPKGKGVVIGISLQSQDRYILETMKTLIGVETKIVDTKRNESVLSVRSEKIANDLSKYGIVPRKTFTVSIPEQIPPKLERHFIRGLFDGDGTVFINKYEQLKFGFYGNKKTIEQVHAYLHNEINLPLNKITHKPTVSAIYYGRKENVLDFYNFLYKDSNIYLTRKKEKFETYFKMKNFGEFAIDVNTVVTASCKNNVVP